MFKKILLPVDHPDYDKKTLDIVKDMALKYNSEIVIFNSQDLSPNIYWVNDPVMISHSPVNSEDFAKDIVSKVATFFKDSGIKTSELTSIGDPASEILNLTNTEDTIDIVVMSTHGMSTTKRFLLGSVTNKVVHHINIPILIIR